LIIWLYSYTIKNYSSLFSVFLHFGSFIFLAGFFIIHIITSNELFKNPKEELNKIDPPEETENSDCQWIVQSNQNGIEWVVHPSHTRSLEHESKVRNIWFSQGKELGEVEDGRHAHFMNKIHVLPPHLGQIIIFSKIKIVIFFICDHGIGIWDKKSNPSHIERRSNEIWAKNSVPCIVSPLCH